MGATVTDEMHVMNGLKEYLDNARWRDGWVERTRPLLLVSVTGCSFE